MHLILLCTHVDNLALSVCVRLILACTRVDNLTLSVCVHLMLVCTRVDSLALSLVYAHVESLPLLMCASDACLHSC